jgi:hypothetical protein
VVGGAAGGKRRRAVAPSIVRRLLRLRGIAGTGGVRFDVIALQLEHKWNRKARFFSLVLHDRFVPTVGSVMAVTRAPGFRP